MPPGFADGLTRTLVAARAREISARTGGLILDFPRVADKIAAADIPCIVGPVITIPARESDRYDKAYANIGLLSKAGVRVAIRTNDVENVRNLPFNAGFAIAYNISTALFGGTAPAVNEKLIALTGSDLVPAFYMMAASAVGAARGSATTSTTSVGSS